ncbi:MAG TPA: hypothetical protein VFT22_06630 [Kofleriaceae bacterium]|nr:hypothetical protein [Kofleriaceae bacterium]
MANRKATFAKRQREADLKDRAKQKEDRRNQKRTEVRGTKGPQIAWDEAVHAVTTSDELPPLETANGTASERDEGGQDSAETDEAPPTPLPATAAGPAAPRRAG